MAFHPAFLTPESAQTVEIVEKKSRFIADLAPVSSVEEAESFLESIRTMHKTASHHCFAYTIGLGMPGNGLPTERFSDAGEPSGTAGRPILEVIRRRYLRNAIVVVTRYFGGTLLGANGLVRAYTEACAEVLNAASLLECGLMQRVVVCCDYGSYGKVEHGLTQLGHTLLDKSFGADVSFVLWLQPEQVAGVEKSLAEWTSGQATTEVSPAAYVGVKSDGVVVSIPHGLTQTP